MTAFRFKPVTPHPLLSPYIAKMWVFESSGCLPALDKKLIVPNANFKLAFTCRNGLCEKQNDEFTLTMTGDSFFNFTVEQLIPGKRIVWLISDCNMPWYSDKEEWANTRLIFDLTEHSGVTDMNFTHEGLRPDLECYKDCAPGWTHWIKTSLFSYLSTGEGVFGKPTK